MVSRDVPDAGVSQVTRIGTGARPTRRIQCSGSVPAGDVDESKEIAPDATRFWGHDTLGGDRSNCGVDGIAALFENLPASFGRQVVRCYDRV
jgi:hypothetical protein